jgi:signal transduction histidine kinase
MYDRGVEDCIKPDRASAVAAAAAHELNDELTVILSSISNSLDALSPQDPLVPLLEDVRAAAQRCAWKATAILNFTTRQGTRPAATRLANLAIS